MSGSDNGRLVGRSDDAVDGRAMPLLVLGRPSEPRRGTVTRLRMRGDAVRTLARSEDPGSCLAAQAEGVDDELERGFLVGGWAVRPLAHQLVPPGRGAEPIHLQPRSVQVLLELARQQGQFVTKRALFSAVWGHRYVTDDALVYAVGALRKAFADDHKCPSFIETRKAVGYRLIPPVSPLPARPALAAFRRWSPAATSALVALLAAALTWTITGVLG